MHQQLTPHAARLSQVPSAYEFGATFGDERVLLRGRTEMSGRVNGLVHAQVSDSVRLRLRLGRRLRLRVDGLVHTSSAARTLCICWDVPCWDVAQVRTARLPLTNFTTYYAQVSDSTLLRLQTQMNPESLAASSCEARADYKGHDFATGAAPV